MSKEFETYFCILNGAIDCFFEYLCEYVCEDRENRQNKGRLMKRRNIIILGMISYGVKCSQVQYSSIQKLT